MTKGEDKRLFYVGSVALLTVALAGLISGTQPPPKEDPLSTSHATNGAEVARSYSDLRQERRGPNAHMYEGAFAWLRGLGPELTDPVEQSEEQRDAARAERRERRAYAGAPPVVPHPIQQREAAACLACHETGSLVGGLRAPMMSHEKYTMCVQCHAPQRDEAPSVAHLTSTRFENSFVGAKEPGRGSSAWEGAPPTVPHSTFMREECNSCHGPYGAQGLRTPHPVRTSCTQCHASSAEFDQRTPPPLSPHSSAKDLP